MPTIGSQALVRILPRTSYDFTGLTGATVRIPVAQHIDVLGYQRAALQVRVYSASLPAGATVTVQLADDGFSADDPASAFLQTTKADGGEIGSIELTEHTVFPFYQSISSEVPGVFGRLMAVLLSVKGGADAGPSIEFGLDLVLTGGSVGATISQPSSYLGYAHELVERVETFERLTVDEPEVAAGGDALVNRLTNAIRDAVQSRAQKLPGYPRFGNVNVAIARPDLNDETAPSELTTVVADLLARGGFNVETPDGGYARFGNVNVGIGDPGQPDDLTGGGADG